RGLPPRAPAALAGGRLQDRRRLPERRSAAGGVLRGPRGDARRPPPRLPATARRRAVGSLHRRHHRVRPTAPLLLEPVRGPGRAALYHAPELEPAPDLVVHSADGYDPKGALAKRELFGRSALTGMHTYADSLFFVNRPGVPADGLDIVDLAPTVLALLGVQPPP